MTASFDSKSLILAVDPAWSGPTGWCLLDGTRLHSYGHLTSEQAWDWPVRSALLAQAARLVIEDAWMGKNAATHAKLTEARCLWSVPARDLYHLPVQQVRPEAWMRAITGNRRFGGSAKNYDQIMAYLLHRYPTIDRLNKDEAAAIGLATYARDTVQMQGVVPP